MAAPRICSVHGCSKVHLARGYCKNHYWAFKKYGDPNGRKTAPYGSGLAFLNECLSTETDECITWPFHRMKNGYPMVRSPEGRVTIASRLVCIMAHGEPASPNLQAAHSCGNGHLGCVNPAHLRWKTALENTREKIVHGTMLRGSKSGMAKLKEDDVLRIRALLASGGTVSGIARDYGVWPACISRIKNRQRWRHL